MSAYFIAHRRRITNPEALKRYQHVDATLAKFGGVVLVREEDYQVLEGAWHPGQRRDDSRPERITVIKFPDRAKLEQWYNSPEYAPLKDIRTNSAEFDAIAADGA